MDMIELAERCERGAEVQWLTSDIDGLTRALIGPSWTMNDWGLVNDAIRENSLDAVVALLERVLPGWLWNVSNFDGNGKASAFIGAGPLDDTADGAAASPARALLGAILRALAAKDETP